MDICLFVNIYQLSKSIADQIIVKSIKLTLELCIPISENILYRQCNILLTN